VAASQGTTDREAAAKRERQEARGHANHIEASCMKMLRDTNVSEDHIVVGAVKVLIRAVTEVWPHDSDPTLRNEAVAHPLEKLGDRLLIGQVLKEVRNPDPAEVRLGKADGHDIADNQLHGGLRTAVVDEVDAPAFGR